MKKRFLAVAAATVMTMAMTITAFADTESDLLAHYGFDENTTNEVTGDDATQTGKAFADPAGTEFSYVDGVNGKAIELPKENTDGFNLNVAATGDSYTISFWAKCELVNGFAEPIIWYGGTNQSPEAWVGIWPGLLSNWGGGGPVIGSNDSSGARVGVTALPNDITTDDDKVAFDWHMITATIDNGTGRLYYDGQLVGMNVEANGDGVLPSVTGEDKSFYLGVNAWDSPFAGTIDEVYIYDRALTSDDVKELYEATNEAGVPSADLTAYEEPTTRLPQLADKNQFAVGGDEADDTTDSTDESGDNTMMIVIIVVVVVVIIVVVVAVAASSKKKKTSGNE